MATSEELIQTVADIVPGLGEVLDEITGVDASELKTRLAILTGQSSFPGPNPVSIDRSHFPAFKEQPYLIADKTDGVRFALMMTRYKGRLVCVLFDRTLKPYIFRIQKCPRTLGQGTVFDGELVRSVSGTMFYLIFDAFVCCGVPVFLSPFEERLSVAAKSLTHYEHTANKDTAVITVKKFYTKNNYAKETGFMTDGLIFMPAHEHIVIGRHDRLFKLKTDHTLDFVVKNGKLYVYDEKAKRNKLVGVPVGPCRELATEGSIVECRLDPSCSKAKQDKWLVIKRRTDKACSNSRFTYEKTLLNIREQLTCADIPMM